MVAANMVVDKVGEDGKPIVYNAKMTVYMFMVAIVGSFGGLLFGYDIGVTGGKGYYLLRVLYILFTMLL